MLNKKHSESTDLLSDFGEIIIEKDNLIFLLKSAGMMIASKVGGRPAENIQHIHFRKKPQVT